MTGLFFQKFFNIIDIHVSLEVNIFGQNGLKLVDVSKPNQSMDLNELEFWLLMDKWF